MARAFGSDPALNNTFIECNPPKRIHQDTAGPAIWCLTNHHVAARRMVRKNPQPSIL